MANSIVDTGEKLIRTRKLVTTDGTLRSVEGAINHVNGKVDGVSSGQVNSVQGRAPSVGGNVQFQEGDIRADIVKMPVGHTPTGYSATTDNLVDQIDGLGEAIIAVAASGVGPNSVDNTKLTQVTGPVLKGRVSGSGNVQDITNMAQVRGMLNVADGATRNPDAIETTSVGKLASIGSGSPATTSYMLFENDSTGALFRAAVSSLPSPVLGAGTVTFTQVQNVSTARLLGRVTAGSGSVEELTKAQALTFLNVADGATANPDAIETSSVGALTGLTGKTTPVSADLLLLQDSAAGGVFKSVQVGNLPANIANGSLALTKLATQAANTVLANTTGSSASPTAVTLASFKTWLAIAGTDIAVGYTPANYSTGGQNLVQHLTGIDTAIAALVASGVTDNSVTNAKLADMANGTIKARITAGSGDPEDATAAQIRTLLNVANGATANPDAIETTSVSKLAALTESTSIGGSDLIMFERSSDGALRKIQSGNLVSGGGSPDAAWTTKREMLLGTNQLVRPIDVLQINVKSLGAVGDGTAHTVQNAIDNNSLYGTTGWTDIAAARTITGISDLAPTDTMDWVGWQRAFNLGSAIGRRIYAPNGHYRLNRTLTYTASQTVVYATGSTSAPEQYLPAQGPVIEGESTGGCFLQWSAVNSVWTGEPDDGRGYGIKMTGNASGNSQIGVLGNVIMRNMTIWGPSQLPANNTVGLFISSYNHLTLDHVQIYNWGKYAYHLMRKKYSVGVLDDRSNAARLIQCRCNRIGKDFTDSANPGSGVGLFAGADSTWANSGTSTGYEVDHIHTASCELMGGGYGAVIYAQEYSDTGTLFSGNLAGVYGMTGNTNHTSNNWTFNTSRFEQDPKIANALFDRVNNLTMISCRFIGGNSPFADAEYPHAPAIWFARESNHNCRFVLIAPDIAMDGRTEAIRVGRAEVNSSIVHGTVFNPIYFPTIDPLIQKEVNIIGQRAVAGTYVNNKSVVVVRDGFAYKWDEKGDGYQVLPALFKTVPSWPPTSGTFQSGDLVSNEATTLGTPSGGRCVSRGTVGTMAADLRAYGINGQDGVRLKGTVMPTLAVGQFLDIGSQPHTGVPRRIVRVPTRHMDGPTGKVASVGTTSQLILAVGSNFHSALRIEVGDVAMLDGIPDVYRITAVTTGSGTVTLTLHTAMASAPAVGTPVYVSKLRMSTVGAGPTYSTVEFNFNADVATGFAFIIPDVATHGLTLPGEGGWRLSSYSTATRQGNIHTPMAAALSNVGVARVHTAFIDATHSSGSFSSSGVTVGYKAPTFIPIPGQATFHPACEAIEDQEFRDWNNDLRTKLIASGALPSS